MTESIKLPPLPEGWETELLDWVSACQSAYHIDNTPGHRFGGLGSNLEENRLEIICFVRGLIESHAAALQSQDREDALRYRWLLDRCYRWPPGGRVCNEDDQSEAVAIWTKRRVGDDPCKAIDHARRIEGEGNDI